MFEMSIFTAAIVYSTLGVVVGILLSTGVFYSFTYSKIKSKNNQLRDACLLYQQQLTRLFNKNKALEVQARTARDQDVSVADQFVADELIDTELDDTVVTPAVGGKRLTWTPERRKPVSASGGLEQRLEQLEQEKQALEKSLEQATGRWKHERSLLEGVNYKLQSQLGSSSSTDADADADALRDQQEGWKRAQQLLQQQINTLKSDKKALATELLSQVGQSEREKQALEDEIELLTGRMLRLQADQPAVLSTDNERSPDEVNGAEPFEALDELAALDTGEFKTLDNADDDATAVKQSG